MKLSIELDREENGRWLAEVLELPGVMAYGQTRDEAVTRAQELALRVLAERETAILSEAALAVDWIRPEEDAAWSHLQSPAK
jgi:predicted RNase H-like HicB family nuclease